MARHSDTPRLRADHWTRRRPPGKSSRLPATARRRLQLGRKKTGAVLLEKVISGSGEKACWLIYKKSDFFRSAGNYFGENKPVWLIFRKDNYFYVLGKKPRDLGFFVLRRKKLYWLIFRKIWVLFARQSAPKFARFFFPDRPVVGTKPAAR